MSTYYELILNALYRQQSMPIEGFQDFRPGLDVLTLTTTHLMGKGLYPEPGAGHRVGDKGIIALLERCRLHARQLKNL
jgi:hypothetical protein